jgi:hypothetical protein
VLFDEVGPEGCGHNFNFVCRVEALVDGQSLSGFIDRTASVAPKSLHPGRVIASFWSRADAAERLTFVIGRAVLANPEPTPPAAMTSGAADASTTGHVGRGRAVRRIGTGGAE